MRIDTVTVADLLRRVEDAVSTGERLSVMYVNIHCMNVAGHDARYREILNGAGLVYCDGTGVRLGARIAGKSIPARMTGADWIHDLARVAVRKRYRLFLVAGEPGMSERAAAALRARHPGLQIVGALPGYGIGAREVERITAAKPDIVLVGMGTPTQEYWMSQHGQDLNVPVVWAVGALFDFVSGRLRRGPRVLTEHGLEWLCRLAVEPRKLWRRYLIGNPLFFARIVATYGVRGLLRPERPPGTGSREVER